jgi:hypothetical protein
MPPWSGRSRLAIVALLVCQAVALLYEARHLSLTPDEPSHLTAGYMYWTGRDFLFPSDTPPLTRIVSGWVPLLLQVPFDIKPEPLETQSAYAIGSEQLASLDGAAARRLIFWCRMPFLIFPLLITALMWHWGRALFGEGVVLVLASCAALEPTILGHGVLIKSDVPAAAMALLFCCVSWRYWRGPTAGWLAGVLLATVAATLTKFSLLPLAPVAMFLLYARGRHRLGVALVPLTIYVGILASYQFQVRMFSTEDLDPILHLAVPDGWRPLVLPAMHLVPWPIQFLRGIGFIGGADLGGGFASSYMLGHRLDYAAPWYFPLCLAIKCPIALQILAVAGIVATCARIRSGEAGAADAIVWLPAVYLFGLALRSHIHLGFRHLLPMIPLLILGAGFGLRRWPGLGVIALWLLGASVFIYPHGISYFNEWIGGPGNGGRYLVDSNLDWGQDLADLERYVREHHVEGIRTAYFGPEPVSHYLPIGSFEPIPLPYDPEGQFPARYVPEPGVYAVSLNLVTGVVLPPAHEDYFARFRDLKPEGRAGWSIFIYRLAHDTDTGGLHGHAENETDRRERRRLRQID